MAETVPSEWPAGQSHFDVDEPCHFGALRRPGPLAARAAARPARRRDLRRDHGRRASAGHPPAGFPLARRVAARVARRGERGVRADRRGGLDRGAPRGRAGGPRGAGEHKEGQSLFMFGAAADAAARPDRDGAGPLRLSAAGVGGGAAQGAGGDAGRGARLRRSARGRRAPPRARGVPGPRPGRGGERGRPGHHVGLHARAVARVPGARAPRGHARRRGGPVARRRLGDDPVRRARGRRRARRPSTGSIRRAWTRTPCSSRPRTSSRRARCSHPSAAARCWPGAGSCSRTTTTPSTATTAPPSARCSGSRRTGWSTSAPPPRRSRPRCGWAGCSRPRTSPRRSRRNGGRWTPADRRSMPAPTRD